RGGYCCCWPACPPAVPPQDPLVPPLTEPPAPPPVPARDFVAPSPVVLVPDLLDVSPVVVLLEPRTEVSPRVVVREWIELRSRSSTPTPRRWPRSISTLTPPP